MHGHPSNACLGFFSVLSFVEVALSHVFGVQTDSAFFTVGLSAVETCLSGVLAQKDGQDGVPACAAKVRGLQVWRHPRRMPDALVGMKFSLAKQVSK